LNNEYLRKTVSQTNNAINSFKKSIFFVYLHNKYLGRNNRAGKKTYNIICMGINYVYPLQHRFSEPSHHLKSTLRLRFTSTDLLTILHKTVDASYKIQFIMDECSIYGVEDKF